MPYDKELDAITLPRILDALHVTLTTHMMYHYLIDSFGDYDGLHNVIWYVMNR